MEMTEADRDRFRRVARAVAVNLSAIARGAPDDVVELPDDMVTLDMIGVTIGVIRGAVVAGLVELPGASEMWTFDIVHDSGEMVAPEQAPPEVATGGRILAAVLNGDIVAAIDVFRAAGVDAGCEACTLIITTIGRLFGAAGIDPAAFDPRTN